MIKWLEEATYLKPKETHEAGSQGTQQTLGIMRNCRIIYVHCILNDQVVRGSHLPEAQGNT